ncbi:hypothetical protein CSA56_03855 [candidate division KSB3 bacterium]|uniref:Glycosyltransferase RgtA/B/C/D-like domain-containing protein n=1 Tax=candidate division KSB3 bacterium TaxID=2044937 RepID=A0A2G6KL54_9BACT|nr:MAG: hypothetical protein CSA56_03855 [candidate division KSB3 bacterium]
MFQGYDEIFHRTLFLYPGQILLHYGDILRLSGMNFSKNTSIPSLVTLSLCYLALPYVFFFLGYLRWYAACPCLLCLLAGLYAHRTISGTPPSEKVSTGSVDISWLCLLLVLCAAFFLLLFSGVGGYGYQDEDWFKHNAIFKALIEHPWPVSYSLASSGAGGSEGVAQIPLVYYVAYYVPAAVVGKLFGWFWANQALFLWTYLGVCLSLLWFIVLARHAAMMTVFIFCLFSGLDALGLFLVRFFFLGQSVPLSQWWHIERWSGNWQYPAHAASVFWVPNQAVAAWIATALILYTLLHSSAKSHLLLYVSLTPLWSPFVTLGLLPYIIVDFLREKKPLVQKMKNYFSIGNVCGTVMLFVVGMFYLSRMYALPVSRVPSASGFIFNHPIVTGLLWYETLGFLWLFLLLEFGVYVIIIFFSGVPLSDREKCVLLVSTVVLTLLPFFRYGFWNDLVMRASAPALFVMSIFVVKVLYTTAARRGIVIVLALALLIGTANSGIEYRRHLVKTMKRGHIFVLPEARSLHDAPNTKVNPSFFFQYIGSADAPFFRYMAKSLQAHGEILTPADLE